MAGIDETQSRQHPSAATAHIASLYDRAFAEFGTRALWNLRWLAHPSHEQVLMVARQLRIEGDMAARRLAEELERAVCANHVGANNAIPTS